jgi:hypothetical protein
VNHADGYGAIGEAATLNASQLTPLCINKYNTPSAFLFGYGGGYPFNIVDSGSSFDSL